MALPIGLGIVLGRYLDGHLGTGSFWTLTLLGAGLAVACLELALAVRLAMREGDHA